MSRSPTRTARRRPGARPGTALKRPFYTRGAAGAATLRGRQTEAWVNVAGHFRTNRHVLLNRTFGECLLIFCRAGGGTYRLGTAVHAVGAGDLFFVPRDHSHGYASDPDTGWDILWCHFNGAYAEQLVRQAGFSPARPLRRLARPRAVETGFRRLLRILRRKGKDADLDATGTLIQLLLELRKQAAPETAEGARADLVALVTEHSENLESLARRAGYSKYHFCHLFKQAVGMPPWAYVLQLKLTRAKELLLETRLSVKEIAVRLGFSDADSFSRLFARHAGVPPRNYRGLMQAPGAAAKPGRAGT